ncbi:MMPL family transporter [Natronoglycomyces albus]|uniref:MMPL family transporter n=1 Tax=Natronoglycomyces albus TaxID=2811108 RepID=A0A895XGN2_9ACTN|nr:MMPL family transporter [Natronoglycomyces albus]QSB04047.1 MMPL family transporter [Natronoglycomyces albus]
MATYLYRLGKGAYRRRWLVLATWLIVLLGIGTAAATMAQETEPNFELPGTESQAAFDLLEERFPGFAADGASARVVFVAEDGHSITESESVAAIERVLAEIAEAPQLASISNPFEEGPISLDETMALANISFTADAMALSDDARDALTSAIETGQAAGLTVEAGGDAFMVEPDLGTAELVGLAVAAVVLAFTFGALVAAGLPILTAIIGVGIGVAGISAATYFTDLSSETGTLATMLGLAVGIDYALFILMRYRAELAGNLSREEAMGRAVGTAGSAVFFAGLTVAIALTGLSVVQIPFLTKMALAAAATVLVAVVIALTLLPALAGIAGKRIHTRKQRAAIDAGKQRTTPTLGRRWSTAVVKRPLLTGLTGILFLGVIAIPMTDMELALPDEGSFSEESTQRQAYDFISEGFGPGFNGPLLMVGDLEPGTDPFSAAAEAAAAIDGLEGVLAVDEQAMPNEQADTVLFSVIPEHGPASAETTQLVHDIRAELAGFSGADWAVSGPTAIDIDISETLADALPFYLALIVGLSLILLLMVFRSLLVPLTAALGFLLSVAAAMGALVAVFQWGWASSLFGIDEPGPIMSVMPILMIGIVFGLAMDYQIFLVTRMREAYVHGEDPRQAIVTGFSHSARVVTAAALIMISVFAAFIFSPEDLIAPIGFGLAVAIAFDAFVVRMTIIPALLSLLGKGAWWVPRWLDRIIPNVDVEGEKLQRQLGNSVDEAAQSELVGTKS